MILAVAMLCGIGTAAHAQLDGGIFNHLGVGVGVGTTGIDLELAAPVTDYLQVRAGVSIMPKFSMSGIKVDMPSEAINQWNTNKDKLSNWGSYDINQITKDGGNALTATDKATIETLTNTNIPNKIEVEGTFKRTDFKFLVDIYPVPKWSFHITTGFFTGTSDIINITNSNCQQQLQAVTDYNANLAGHSLEYIGQPAITFGAPIQAQFEKKSIKIDGPTINAQLKTKSFKPYLGIGFGRAVPKKTRLAFACDLGVQFWGKPELVVQGEKFTKDDVDEDFLKTIEQISVYPVMSFRLTGKIF